MLKNLHLRNRMLIIILGINLLMLSLIFVIYYEFSKQLIIGETKEKAMGKISVVANSLQGYLNEKAKIAWTFSQDPKFVRWLATNNVRHPDKKKDKMYADFIQHLNKLVYNDNEIESAFFASEKTQWYYDSTERPIPEDYQVGLRDWYRDCIDSGEPQYNVDFDLVNQKIYASYIYPIFNDEGAPLGIGGIDIGMNNFDEVMKVLDDVFESGEAMLFSEDGTVLYHPNRNFVLNKRIDDFYDDGNRFMNMNQVAESIMNQQEGIQEVVFDWEKKYLIYKPIKELSWTLMLSVNVSEIKSPLKALANMSVFTIGLSCLFLVLAITFVTGTITRPIQSLVGRIKDIAQGEGDLSKRLDIEGRDEVGELAQWLNLFLDKIQAIILHVSQNAQEVLNASRVITETSEHMNHGAQEQSVQTSTIASSTNQMSSTIMETSRIYNQAVEIARQAMEKARMGGEIVRESIDEMDKISRAVDTSHITIEDLGNRSTEIGKVIRVINEIADQTNLLALNARIEASNAGEQGRGFAVVAEDVRELAESTTQATKEISSIISAIQDDTRKAVGKMSEGAEEVKSGRNLVLKSGEVLDDIERAVSEVQRVISELAKASDQMSYAAEEITSNIKSVSGVSSSTADSTRELSVISSQLYTQASSLNDLVGRFKLSDN